MSEQRGLGVERTPLERSAVPRRHHALVALVALCCGAPSAPDALPPDNVMVIIVDDIGREDLRAYGERANQPSTPSLDGLASRGIVFRNVWSNPVCAPARAAVLTGRYAFRTGIGSNMKSSYLPRTATIIPKILGDRYQSAAIGKWHLAGRSKTERAGSHGLEVDLDHPRVLGFDHFSGTMGNIGAGRGKLYRRWEKVVDGQPLPELVTEYATSVTTDDALAAIARMREPWFSYVAYHAAHAPLHAPPDHLHSQDLEGSGEERDAAMYRAMIEALDAEVGRLLSSVSPEVMARTTVIFLGDNGAKAAKVAEEDNDERRGKRTLYEGGIAVPFIVAGARVAPALRGTLSDALVDTVDILATVADIAGVSHASPDSRSLLPLLESPSAPSLRRYGYSEMFRPDGLGPYRYHDQAIRDQRFKLVREDCRDTRFFDLRDDPGEQHELLAGAKLSEEQSLAYASLRTSLSALTRCRIR